MKKTIVLFVLILLTACDTFWHRSSNVAVMKASFPECAYNAVAKFRELTLVEHYKQQGKVVGHTPYSMFNVSLNKYGNAEVVLNGLGFNPQPEVEQGVNDLLALLTRAVTYECNRS